MSDEYDLTSMPFSMRKMPISITRSRVTRGPVVSTSTITRRSGSDITNPTLPTIIRSVNQKQNAWIFACLLTEVLVRYILYVRFCILEVKTLRTLKVAAFTFVAMASLLASSLVVVVCLSVAGVSRLMPQGTVVWLAAVLSCVVNALLMLAIAKPWMRFLEADRSQIMQVGAVGIPLVILITMAVRDYVKEQLFHMGDMAVYDQGAIDFTTATVPFFWLMPFLFLALWQLMLMPRSKAS
jgi:hypothetical protein